MLAANSVLEDHTLAFLTSSWWRKDMIHKTLFTLAMLTCIVLLASCSSRQTSPTPESDMPNPASVYCEQNGGKLEFRQDALGGVSGVCIFPDGSECKGTLLGSYTTQSYSNLFFMGWAPDSEHFLLNLSKDGRLVVPYLCADGEQPVKLTDTDDALPIVWVDAQRVLFASHGKALHLQHMGAPSILLDADASSWFDYTHINPSTRP
jgi:putative hemolysin